MFTQSIICSKFQEGLERPWYAKIPFWHWLGNANLTAGYHGFSIHMRYNCQNLCLSATFFFSTYVEPRENGYCTLSKLTKETRSDNTWKTLLRQILWTIPEKHFDKPDLFMENMIFIKTHDLFVKNTHGTNKSACGGVVDTYCIKIV